MADEIGLWDVWIDHQRYEVPHGVCAEINRLKALIVSLTKSLESRPVAPPPPWTPANERWTPNRKHALLNAIEVGLSDAPGAMTVFGVSQEELEAWLSGRTHLKAVGERAR